MLGLAYLRAYHENSGDERFKAYWRRGKELLLEVTLGGMQDPAVATAMAHMAGEASNLAAAEQTAKEVLTRPDLSERDRVQAVDLLANVCLLQNRYADAEQHFEKLVQLRLEPGDWYLLGVCRQRQGDLAGGIEALEYVVRIDPSQPRTYRTLAELHGAAGDADQQQSYLERAKWLEANLPK